MTYITALEIESNWPDNVKIVHTQDEATKRFGSIMYMLRDGQVHKVMLTLNPVYKTKKTAIGKMKELAKFAIAVVNNKEPKTPNLSPKK